MAPMIKTDSSKQVFEFQQIKEAETPNMFNYPKED